MWQQCHCFVTTAFSPPVLGLTHHHFNPKGYCLRGCLLSWSLHHHSLDPCLPTACPGCSPSSGPTSCGCPCAWVSPVCHSRRRRGPSPHQIGMSTRSSTRYQCPPDGDGQVFQHHPLWSILHPKEGGWILGHIQPTHSCVWVLTVAPCIHPKSTVASL